MNPIKAVVFDVDGTLLDTREFISRAFEHTLQMYGYPIPSREFIASHMGLPLDDCYQAFAPGGDLVAFRDQHRAFQVNNYELVDSYEGLIDTMDTLRNAGLGIGICSTRAKLTVIPTLVRVGIKDHCDVIIDGNSVGKYKPDPEGFYKAIQAMGVEASQAAMVGDTRTDIETGKNAGAAFTIGVTHGFGTRESLEKARADYIIERLPDLIPLLVGA